MKGIKIEVEHERPIFLYRSFDMVDAIAYAIYYTANPDSEMCIPNCAYEKAEKIFREWKDEVSEKKEAKGEEMTKDELEKEAEEYAKKNGSCFSKEYGIRYRTYMDCAESREKRIAELEKENAELKQEKIPQLERKIASIRGAHSVDCKKLNARIEQVKRLQEENKELRVDSIQLSKARTLLKLANGELITQLARAEELIRKLYPHVFQGMDFMELNDFNVLKAEAENFLKENEVEK